MEKILLIGDSIRLSYGDEVAKLLTDKAEVTGPADNCRFSAYTPQIPPQIITWESCNHKNFGF
jgi:hypothetical protein